MGTANPAPTVGPFLGQPSREVWDSLDSLPISCWAVHRLQPAAGPPAGPFLPACSPGRRPSPAHRPFVLLPAACPPPPTCQLTSVPPPPKRGLTFSKLLSSSPCPPPPCLPTPTTLHHSYQCSPLTHLQSDCSFFHSALILGHSEINKINVHGGQDRSLSPPVQRSLPTPSTPTRSFLQSPLLLPAAPAPPSFPDCAQESSSLQKSPGASLTSNKSGAPQCSWDGDSDAPAPPLLHLAGRALHFPSGLLQGHSTSSGWCLSLSSFFFFF